MKTETIRKAAQQNTQCFKLIGAALLLCLVAACALFPAAKPNLKSAIHALLKHGDLADLQYTKAILRVDFRLVQYRNNADGELLPCCNAVAARKPKVLSLSRIVYPAIFRQMMQKTRVDLSFDPTDCPQLKPWAKEWNFPFEAEAEFDAEGVSEMIEMPNDGITLNLHHGTIGQCNMQLLQVTARHVKWKL